MTTLNLATWRFYVDLNGDGDWSDADEDVTAYVQSASWRLGCHQPWQLAADVPTCTLTLVNTSKRFSPEYAAGPLYGSLKPGRRIRITSETPTVMNDGVTSVVDNSGNQVVTANTHWTGYITSIAPTPMQYAGPFLTTITGQGIEAYLKTTEANLGLLTNTTVAAIVAALVAKIDAPPPALVTSLEDGLLLYPYAGDNFDRFASVYDGLAAVAAAERGRLFTDRNGTIVFWNRRHLQVANTPVAVYANTMQGLAYDYGDDIINDVRVTTYPRALSATATETLWSLDAAVTLPPGGSQTMTARYAAADGQQVAGTNVTTPNTADGSLAFNEGSATISGFTLAANSATFTLVNTSASQQCVVKTCVIHGQKLTSWNAQEIADTDAASIAAYGRQAERIDARLLGDTIFAGYVVQEQLLRRKAPRGLVKSITFKNKDNATLYEMAHRSMGDRVTVTEAQTAVSADYCVVGEQHDWRDGGRNYTATLSLEPAPPWACWLLGVPGRSELGVTTILGF